MKSLIILMALLAVGCIQNQKTIEIDGANQVYKYTSSIDEGEATIEDLRIDFIKQDGNVILKARIGESRSTQEDNAIDQLVEAYKADPSLFEALPGWILELIRTIAGL